MSNDLASILARHNLRGINVANFSGSSQQRPTPQQHQPYQYPAPVPQQRVQYPWSGQGSGNVSQGSGNVGQVRPSFAWPAPPQPQYTIDPRHYSYNIWGKAPVYSLTGQDEEEDGEDSVEGEEDIAEAGEGEKGEAAAEAGENIEAEKPAEEAATETIPVAVSPDAGEKDIPLKDPVPDAAGEPAAEQPSPDVPPARQPSDPPQEEATTATPPESGPPESGPPEEKTATDSTETAPQESERDAAAEPQPEEAQESESAPSETIDGVEPNHQDSGDFIEVANASERESTASEMPAPVEIVEDVKGEDGDPEPASEPAQEERADESQPSGSAAGEVETNVIDVTRAADASQEGLPSDGISTVEEHTVAEHDVTPPEAQSSDPTTSPEENDETVTAEASTTPDNIQDTVPAAADEIVQVTDDSTDDTAAIIVIDVESPGTTPDTNILPPPPPAPRVMISEPVKPSKSNKKKSSSGKSSKSRHVERPVEIIPLREVKAKAVAKGKSKKKVRGKAEKVINVEGGDTIPPPPPPAPSPPPSGCVIEVVAVEEMQVIDEPGGKDKVQDAVIPDFEAGAGENGEVEQPDDKEERNHDADAPTALPPGGDKVETPDIVDSAKTAFVAVPDQNEQVEPTPATADPSSSPDTYASEGAEIEKTVEAVAADQKEDDASAAISPPLELGVVDSSQEEENLVKEEEGPASPEDEPLTPQEATVPIESESKSPPGDSAVKSAPADEEHESKHAKAPEMEKPNEAPVEETVKNESGADSLTSQEEKASEPSSPATEKPKSPDGETGSTVEENNGSDSPTIDAVDAVIPEAPIDAADAENRTSKVPEEVSTSEASELGSGNTTGTDSAPSVETEASLSPEPPAPVDETPPATSAEVVAESAPTLMELAALILLSDPVPQNTEDVVAKKDEPNDAAIDGEVCTKQTSTEREASGYVSDAAVAEDSDAKEDVLVMEQEKNEDVKHEASGETANEALYEDKEPEVSTETAEPAKVVADDQDLDQTDSKADRDHSKEAVHVDEETALEQVDKGQSENETVAGESIISPDADAQPVQDTETSEAGNSTLPDAADVQSVDAQDTVVPADVATESLETPLIVSEEQNHGPDESNENASVQEAPEAAEAAEDDTKDLSLADVEGQVAVDTATGEAGDTVVSQVEDTGASTAENASSDLVDDTVVEGVATTMAQPESVTTESPASIHDEPEVLEPASSPDEDIAVDKVEAEEVTSRSVTENTKDDKPAEEAPSESLDVEFASKDTDDVVVQEPATDESQEANDTTVVEAADSGACEQSEEQDPTKPSELAVEEDSSEQSTEAKAEDTPEQLVDTTEDATLSTTGAGADTRQESPLPVLADAEEAQVIEDTEALEHTASENLSGPQETTEATQPVDTAPSLEEIIGPNEESSPGQVSISSLEEEVVEQPTGEPEDSPEETQPSVSENLEASVQEPVTEAEVLPGDSISQQSRCETISDSNSGRRSPLIEEPASGQPASEQPAQEEAAPPSPSKHSSKVSFDEPPVSTKGKEPASPPKERRKSSKSSSSNRHSSSRHKVKDVSRPPSDQKVSFAATSSRRHSSTTTAPQSGLFRRLSTTNSRSSRAEAAEQAEIKRRAAELAVREQEVQRQLERARKRAALEEQERLLREKEDELARLKVAEKEKKRARREEQKRREQEALEQERLARERAEEEARAKELERAERRERRREAERAHHGDDRPRTHKHSSNRESKARDISPTVKPTARRQRTDDLGPEPQRSRGEHGTRGAPTSSGSPEERRYRRSSRRDSEKAEKPKKSMLQRLLSKI